jgi:hypothetical protein
MRPCKNISHPSLVIYFFTTLKKKLKVGLQMGGRVLIANHQKEGAAVRSYLLLSSLAGARLFAVPFTSLSKQLKSAGPKAFCLAKLACF